MKDTDLGHDESSATTQPSFGPGPNANLFHRFTTQAGWVIGVFWITTIMSVVLTQILFRKGLNNPLPWPEEAAQLSLVLLTFIGAGVLATEDLHIQVGALTDRLPTSAARIIEIIRTAIMIIVPAGLVYGAMPLIIMTFNTKTPALRITRGWIFSLVAFGLMWAVVGAALTLRARLKRIDHPDSRQTNTQQFA